MWRTKGEKRLKCNKIGLIFTITRKGWGNCEPPHPKKGFFYSLAPNGQYKCIDIIFIILLTTVKIIFVQVKRSIKPFYHVDKRQHNF